MPIEGKFYTSKELQSLLDVSKQRISNLAKRQSWTVLVPGLYCAEGVEDYLMWRGIDPASLPIRTQYSEEEIMDNEVKIKAEDGKAHCPICGQEGKYKEGGQTCTESIWVWEDDKLVAVPNRE
jgi:hypothetical protein